MIRIQRFKVAITRMVTLTLTITLVVCSNITIAYAKDNADISKILDKSNFSGSADISGFGQETADLGGSEVTLPNKASATSDLSKSAVKQSLSKYTAQEIEMIQYVVQNEAGYMSKRHKQIITEVILNRVKSKKFPNTIKGVLCQKGQFTSWVNYLNKVKKPTTATKNAVVSALSGEVDGISKGALYFYAPTITRSLSTKSWFERQTFVMQITEVIYGVTYIHRFFK